MAFNSIWIALSFQRSSQASEFKAWTGAKSLTAFPGGIVFLWNDCPIQNRYRAAKSRRDSVFSLKDLLYLNFMRVLPYVRQCVTHRLETRLSVTCVEYDWLGAALDFDTGTREHLQALVRF
jgi:hypothetical protein